MTSYHDLFIRSPCTLDFTTNTSSGKNNHSDAHLTPNLKAYLLCEVATDSSLRNSKPNPNPQTPQTTCDLTKDKS